MAKQFTSAQLRCIRAKLLANAERYGIPLRKCGSAIVGSFNSRSSRLKVRRAKRHVSPMNWVLVACGAVAICAAACIDLESIDTPAAADTPAAVSTEQPDFSDPAGHSRAYPVDAGDGPQLVGLSLDSDRLPGTVSLLPEFNGDALDYSAAVPYEIAQLTVTVAPGDGASSSFVEVDGVTVQPDADGGAPGHQVALAPGENLLKVRAAAGQSGRVYSITVVRAKPTIKVSAPKASVGEGDVAEFIVERSPAAPDALRVFIDVGETGDLVDDRHEGIKAVDIPAEAASASHTVHTHPDDAAWDSHSIVAATLRSDDS